MSDDKPFDLKDLKEVLEVVNDKVPSLLTKLLDSIMKKENAEEYAKQVGTFYKELKQSGMDDRDAIALTKSFMDSRDPVALIKGIIKNRDFDEGPFSGRRDKHKEEAEDETEKSE